MKEINLLSLVQTYTSLNPEPFQHYLQYHSIQIKDSELSDLVSFTTNLKLVEPKIQLYNNFYVGYNIPQISKEFDLLKFGKNFNVNIELKSKSTLEKIKKQLVRNQYYLDFLAQKVYSFTYVTEEEKLYTLDKSQNLQSTSFHDLAALLLEQKEDRPLEINKLFNPSNYLVSPLNSTEEFMMGKYFLTGQQEDIKMSASKLLQRAKEAFISICGNAGTGKTLLTYDIAKDFIEKGEKVLIFHCGNLNEGHDLLKTQFGWEISSMKFWASYKIENYSLIIIDETQRVYPYQLECVIKEVKKFNGKCIFSYDSQQWLRKWEFTNNIEAKIQAECSPTKFELTVKIRTNREIASFTKCLFHKNYKVPKIDRSNIQLTFFDNYMESRQYLEFLKSINWKVINYTPSSRDTHPYEKFALQNEDNAHNVIGQEFDKVVAVIDSYFYYKGHDLSTKRYQKKPFYHPTQMLFQIVTRTRRKLHIVIINNKEVMERCVNILNNN